MPGEQEKRRGDAPQGDVPKRDNPGTKAVVKKKEEDDCCCHVLLVNLYSVKVVKKTSTFGVTLTDDDVAITSIVEQPTGPSWSKWPGDRSYFPLGEGQTTSPDPVDYTLATIFAQIGCRAEASVGITAWRIKITQDLQSALQQVVGKAATAAGALSGIPALGGAVESLAKDLYNASGFGPSPMALPFRLDIEGSLACGESLNDLIQGPRKGSLLQKDFKTPLSDNESKIGYMEYNVEGLDGKWTIRLVLEKRKCYKEEPKKASTTGGH